MQLAKVPPRPRVIGRPIVYRGSKAGDTFGRNTYTVVFHTTRSFAGRQDEGGAIKPGRISLGSASDNHDGFTSIGGVTPRCYAWTLTRRAGARDPQAGSVASLELDLNRARPRTFDVRIRAFPVIGPIRFLGPDHSASSVFVRGPIAQDLRTIGCNAKY